MLPYNARYIVFLIFLVMDELKSAHLFRLADFIFVSFLAMSFLYERCRSIVVQSSFNTPSNRLGVLINQAVNQYPSGKGAAPLDPASLLATLCSPWGLRPSQPAAAGCSLTPPCGSMGVGNSPLCCPVWWACYDRTRRSSRPCYARRLNFHVRLVCAHSPNSPAGVASTPFWGGGGWGGTSASPYWAKSASAWSYFAVAAACSPSLPALHRWLALLLRVLCASLLLAAQRV